jgi:hypothetical protein
MKIQQKLPEVNLRIAATDEQGELLLFFLQKERFMLYPNESEDFSTEIKRQYPSLDHVSPPRNLGLMSDRLKNFLKEGNFGSIDPSRPPSIENGPLALYGEKLLQIGIANETLVRPFFEQYIDLNHLRNGQMISWMFDEFLNKLFQQDFFEPINSNRLRPGLVRQVIRKNLNPTKEDFGEYNIHNYNREKSPEIVQNITQASQNWRQLRQNARRNHQALEYYDTEGNLKTL